MCAFVCLESTENLTANLSLCRNRTMEFNGNVYISFGFYSDFICGKNIEDCYR